MFNKGWESKSDSSQLFRMGIFSAIKTCLSHDKLGELLVVCGFISPEDLKSALSKQKHTQNSLGQIFLENGVISKRQLFCMLAAQRTIRVTLAVTVCVVSLSGFSKKVRADNVIHDVAARMLVVSAEEAAMVSANAETGFDNLFGSDEKRSDNLGAFTKWIGMFEKFERAMSTEASQKIIQDMQAELVAYKSTSMREMAEKVNLMMNRQKYILDQKNWGKSDYWATPVEFMMRGGDCEDFAIAKYFALRALGVPEDRMRIAIVHDLKKNIPHAVLVVNSESGLLILDNQTKVVLNDTSISHYKPIFSINRQAWWLHTVPEATIVASAR